jgi:hypothetical protein
VGAIIARNVPLGQWWALAPGRFWSLATLGGGAWSAADVDGIRLSLALTGKPKLFTMVGMTIGDEIQERENDVYAALGPSIECLICSMA